MHIAITYGAVISKKTGKHNQELKDNKPTTLCHLCHNFSKEKKITCINIFCDLVCHRTCLADLILEPGEYIPVQGECPKCNINFLWGDLINKYLGCYANQDVTINLDDDIA